jgi:hypothetical protein
VPLLHLLGVTGHSLIQAMRGGLSLSSVAGPRIWSKA